MFFFFFGLGFLGGFFVANPADKHKVSAPNAPSKSDPNYLPLKKLKRLEKKFTFNTSNIYIS